MRYKQAAAPYIALHCDPGGKIFKISANENSTREFSNSDRIENHPDLQPLFEQLSQQPVVFHPDPPPALRDGLSCWVGGKCGSGRLLVAADSFQAALKRLCIQMAHCFEEQIQEQNASRLETLIQLNQMHNAPIKAIADYILSEGMKLTQSPLGLISLVTPSEDGMVTYAWARNTTERCEIGDFPDHLPPEAGGLWAEAIRRKAPLAVNDYDAPHLNKQGYPAGHLRLRRLISVPLFKGDQLKMLAVMANKPLPYDNTDLNQLTLLMEGMWRHIQLRENAQALKEAKEAADRASDAKSRFLATMSHEIRTPMNAVLGMTDLALQTRLTGQQREYLENVRSAGEHLLGVINDILDLSRIEAGKLSLETVPFPLAETVENMVNTLKNTADKKGLSLGCQLAKGLPPVVVGDRLRLRQILVNLLGNAIKFTETGGVLLKVDEHHPAEPPPDDDDLWLLFSVQDSGIGIPYDKQEKIFEDFCQVDGSPMRNYGGTGLGLSISHFLLSLMGGKIWLESDPGQGSSFYFVLPLKIGKRQDLGPKQAASPRGTKTPQVETLSILVAEDNEVNFKLARILLESLGHSVIRAANGLEAIDRLKRQRFDLIFMDLEMPKMDGFQATAIIRSWQSDPGVPGDPSYPFKQRAGRTPIIAMTAHALVGYEQRCLEAGMNGYVSKPISKKALETAIADQFSAGAGASVEADSSEDGSAILAVDELMARTGQDRTLVANVLSLFISHVPAQIRECREALIKKDYPFLARQAHTLKGMCANISAARLRQMALCLEEAASRSDDAGIAGWLDKIETQFHILSQYVKQADLLNPNRNRADYRLPDNDFWPG